MTIKKIINGVFWRIRRYFLIFFQKNYLFWQKYGFHIVPNNYSSPIPDTRQIKDSLWNNEKKIYGIDFLENKQTALLDEFIKKYKKEYEAFPSDKTGIPYQYYINNDAYSSVDGEILYCIIRKFNPGKIYEIGSGFSTFCSAQALIKNSTDNTGLLTAFEPYPNEILQKGFPGLHNLVKKDIQEIPISEFEKLEKNDILFIDSSHVLKIGNDVYFEFLQILPRLKKGVLIHIHDIFLPSEYPKEWVMQEYRYYTEQYLLQAFLSFNESFEVLWAGSFMHLYHSVKLEKAFNSYKKDNCWPGSFWIRKIK
jgi:predicted O-methyltransferase YrrM